MVSMQRSVRSGLCRDGMAMVTVFTRLCCRLYTARWGRGKPVRSATRKPGRSGLDSNDLHPAFRVELRLARKLQPGFPRQFLDRVRVIVIQETANVLRIACVHLSMLT